MTPAVSDTSQRGGHRRGPLLAGALLVILSAILAFDDARAPAQSARDELQGKLRELESVQERQAPLQATIERQNAVIDGLIGEVSDLRSREGEVEARLASKQAELDRAVAELTEQRRELAVVRARYERALETLEELLVGIYKSNNPDVLSVILESADWSDLLTEAEYLSRIQEYDEAVVERVAEMREELELIVGQLTTTKQRIEAARDEIAIAERELASARAAAEARFGDLKAAQEERRSTLAALQSREKQLTDDLWSVTTPPGGQAGLVDGKAVPPPGAPLVVRAVIEAANQIADKPYKWGGGHGSFEEDDGYDCSGAISFALHAGGLLSSPLDSGGFSVWGASGPGRWITIFAHSGHAYAVIAGLRWDTSGGNGPRWHTDMRSPAGFYARHPSGY